MSYGLLPDDMSNGGMHETKSANRDQVNDRTRRGEERRMVK